MPSVNYLWDPIEDNVIAEFDDDNNLVVEYTTEPELHGDVISQRRDGETNYFYSDGLGSTTEVTNAAGDTIATRAYSAFGETTESTGSLVFPFQYVGQKGYYRDSETSDYYVRRRAYLPVIGRWNCPDPVALPNRYPNVYLYCYNTVILNSDPSGLKCRIMGDAQNLRGAKFSDFDTMCITPSFTVAMEIMLNNQFGRKKYEGAESITGINIPDLGITGPGIVINKNKDKLEAGSIAIAYWPLFIWFYACQDTRGDCESAVFETMKEEESDEKGMWKDITDAKKKVRHATVNRKALTFPLTTNFGIPFAVDDRCCDKPKSRVIVFADLPNYAAFLKDIDIDGFKKKAGGKRMFVKQEVLIYEAGVDKPVASQVWDFSLEVDLTGKVTGKP